ncbi:MAG: carboxylesterase family protein [Ginsengibacter sp.]
MFFFETLHLFTMHKHYLFLSFFLLLTIPSIAQENNNNYFAVQTKIDNGTIEGNFDTKTGIQLYLGIPFAKPPMGTLRWKAPQPLDNWHGVKQTKKFGPRPVQAIVFGDMNSRSNGLSEDCLYLNVWTPAKRDTKNLPVLVYFYGGGFVAGDGSEPRYDGESLAQKGIVVVTVNYRLGVLGFLSLPQLSAESPYKASGNYGLLDQVAGLKWVQKNIAAFGGNPHHVTIAGESAGSMSVSALMASPLSKNLINAAIGESGASINPTGAPVSLKDAEKTGMEFAKKAGFPKLADLRKLSTKDLYDVYKASGRFGFPVVIDGYFLKNSLPGVFESKQQAMVPLLAGWNSAEIPGIAFMQGLPNTEDNFIKKVKQIFPKNYEEVLKLWPHSNEKEIERSATDLASDGFIVFSTWKWLDLQANNSSQPVYRYLFSRMRPPLIDKNTTAGLAGGTMKSNPNAPKMPEPIGAPHASEIEYALGNLRSNKDYDWTPDDYKVSKTMEDFFANFIINYNPNGDNVPNWPVVKPGDKNPDVMDINVESKAAEATNGDQFEFLDQFYNKKK